MSAPPCILDARGIAAGYGRVPVVRDASFRIQPASAVGLVGHNGAGKTTLFRAVVGQIPLMRGSLALADTHGEPHDISRAPLSQRARLGLGYLPQRPALLWDLSVRDNLLAALDSPAGRAAERWAGPAPRGVVDRAIERVGLSLAAHQVAAELSGGQIKRLSMARLLVLRSRLWLCDEPFAGLDRESVEVALQLIGEVVSEGVAVLITEHRAELLDQLVHTTLRVEDGQLITSEPCSSSAPVAVGGDTAPSPAHVER